MAISANEGESLKRIASSLLETRELCVARKAKRQTLLWRFLCFKVDFLFDRLRASRLRKMLSPSRMARKFSVLGVLLKSLFCNGMVVSWLEKLKGFCRNLEVSDNPSLWWVLGRLEGGAELHSCCTLVSKFLMIDRCNLFWNNIRLSCNAKFFLASKSVQNLHWGQFLIAV